MLPGILYYKLIVLALRHDWLSKQGTNSSGLDFAQLSADLAAIGS